jgi:hypothetical protein
VVTDKIEDSAVSTAKIANGAVLTAKIGDTQVTTGKVADSSITALKLASNSVTSSKIATNNVLTTHIADNQVTTAKIAADQVQASHLKADSVTTNKLLNSAVTADKLAANSVTTSKIGNLTSLTVNGIVNATGFVASGSGSETDGGFALPKAKSLNINFATTQSVTGDDTFVVVGSDSALASVTFAADDNITMSLTASTFRVSHLGTNGTTLTARYQVSYYNSQGVAQSYADVTSQDGTYQLSSSASTDYLLGLQGLIGDGATKIAGIRMRVKHDVASDTLAVKDSLQLTAIVVEDSSGAVTRTYNAGSIS